MMKREQGIDPNDPNIIDIDPGDFRVEEEIEDLSPEDREKIGWGLSTIGFKAEKAKNDFFAGIFNQALKIKKIDPKGTTGRFCTEMRDSFVRDAKIAIKKAEDTASGEEKHRLSNASLLLGNVVRYGRMVTDLTGKSLASPLRYVMMAGMATTRMAEAGKEARLKNEEVSDKTKIGKFEYGDSEEEQRQKYIDVERAQTEAFNLQTKIGNSKGIYPDKYKEGISAEDLRNAYLTELPNDLKKRLENPSTANTFIQGILKEELLGHTVLGHVVFEGSISRLNKNIEKIENNKKLTPEKQKAEIEKLITKQKKNLEDYDRIVTQYGTVDALAMAGRYAQTFGKSLVAVVTAETLVLSAEKLFGTISQILTSHDIHPIDSTEKFVNDVLHGEKTPSEPTSTTPEPTNIPKEPTTTPESAVPPAEPTPNASPETTTPAPAPSSTPIIPENPPVTNNFANEGIKFEKGKGRIQGILDLKKQIAEQYHGDYSKAPKGVQDLMSSDHNAVEVAKKFGFYKPNGEESALIQEGSTLKLDNQGNLIFHDAKTGEDVTHYAGKMFDSDKSGSVKIPTTEHIPESTTHETLNIEHPDTTPTTTESTVPPIEPTPSTNPEPTHAEIVDEKIKEIKAQYPPEEIIKHELGYQTVSGGTTYKTGGVLHTGGEMYTGNEIRTGSEVQIGGGNGYQDQFPDISHEDNLILENHPEFIENPYNLPGEKLMEVYETSHNNLEYLFGKEPSTLTPTWTKLLGTLRVRADEVFGYQEHPSADPTDQKLSDYLVLLRNFSELKPKSGFWGMGAESSEHYIARCLQALAADGKLEVFEKNLRQ